MNHHNIKNTDFGKKQSVFFQLLNINQPLEASLVSE